MVPLSSANMLSLYLPTNSLNHLQLNESNATNLLPSHLAERQVVDASYQQYLFASPYTTFAVALVAGLMSLFTIVGNVLVITAFIIDKNLRKYSNYFILNLSLADLLIGKSLIQNLLPTDLS